MRGDTCFCDGLFVEDLNGGVRKWEYLERCMLCAKRSNSAVVIRESMRKSLNISNRKNRPIHERIYRAFRQKLEKSELKAGERLPSVTSLSRQFKVSKTTVYAAFDLLRRDGLIETFPHRGSFAYGPEAGNEDALRMDESINGDLSITQV